LNLIFDIETDGFLDQVSTIHCLVIHDCTANQTHTFNNQGNQEPIVRGVQMLSDSDSICGHNIIAYDNPVITKLYPWYSPPALTIDTLLLSRLYHPDMMALDKKHNWKHMPLKLYGRHSLESYGYRLNEFKGSFGSNTDWKEWSQEMEDYCLQDVNVTHKLWKHFHPYLSSSS
jgi:hypothetical protein